MYHKTRLNWIHGTLCDSADVGEEDTISDLDSVASVDLGRLDDFYDALEL